MMWVGTPYKWLVVSPSACAGLSQNWELTMGEGSQLSYELGTSFQQEWPCCLGCVGQFAGQRGTDFHSE